MIPDFAAHFSRREMLKRLGGGVGTLGLAALLAPTAGAAPGGAHFKPRAKRIIHLFMNGGPFGPDFLDPKPAINKFAGQRPKDVDLPGFVVLCPGRPVRFAELWASAFLPSEFQGTYINHSNLDSAKMVPHLHNPATTEADQRKQLDLLTELNRDHA